MSDPEFIHPPDPLPTLPGVPPPLSAASPSASAAASAESHTARLTDPSVPHEQRTYGLLTHLSLLLLLFVLPFSFALPLLALALITAVVPLSMWLARRERSRFIADHGREALNFHLTIILYWTVALALTPLCGVGFFMMVGCYILAITGGVMACVAASRAEYFRYPMCVRFVR